MNNTYKIINTASIINNVVSIIIRKQKQCSFPIKGFGNNGVFHKIINI